MSDAKRLRVVVTQEDIDKGASMNAAACPIARAVRRAGYPSAVVFRHHWRPRGELRGESLPIPSRASLFTFRFDHARPVKPATFLLPLR